MAPRIPTLDASAPPFTPLANAGLQEPAGTAMTEHSQGGSFDEQFRLNATAQPFLCTPGEDRRAWVEILEEEEQEKEEERRSAEEIWQSMQQIEHERQAEEEL